MIDYEDSMMDRKLFDMYITLLGDLRSSSTGLACVYYRTLFGGVITLISMDNKQLHPVVPSLKYSLLLDVFPGILGGL